MEENILDEAFIQECGNRDTPLGQLLYIKIRRHDDRPMAWSEVWAVFADRYPDMWGYEVFPPESELVDEVNIYHLFLGWEEPVGLNIRR